LSAYGGSYQNISNSYTDELACWSFNICPTFSTTSFGVWFDLTKKSTAPRCNPFSIS